jgi:hypothetical protein
VGQYADCFSIRHLPELYRKTFSAGNDSLRNLADLFLGSGTPVDQFQSLSEILSSLNARLVVVVEDLDRTDSSRFDRREVLALLQRLKGSEGVSFILTASLTNTADISFAKLGDHIEQLPEFDAAKIGAIIQAVREKCLTQFPDDGSLLTDEDPSRPSHYLLLSRYDLIPRPRAVAVLLRTPRALKHALGRTYRAWQALHGEANFDDLLAVNILRHGAPAAFDFLLRHWNHLHDGPRTWQTDRDRLQAITSQLKSEWQQVGRESDWDLRPAIALFEFLLPATVEYLGETRGVPNTRSQVQGINDRRHLDRITNEEIDPNQVRDQVVLDDLHDWLRTRDTSSALVERIYEGGDYLNRWEHYTEPGFISEPAGLLQLAGQILNRLRTAHGTRASGPEVHDAFADVWRRANRQVPRGPESRKWLEGQIRDAMPYSLPLVLDLYYYWCSSKNGVVTVEDREHIRRLIYDLCKEQFHSGQELIRVTYPELRYDVDSLVYPPDVNDPPSPLRGVEHWQWFGPILLDALRRNTSLFAPKIGQLTSVWRPGEVVGQEVCHVELERLSGLFGDQAGEVVVLLNTALATVEGPDHNFLHQVVRSAQTQQPSLV